MFFSKIKPSKKAVMDEAIDYGANVIISYHPPLFREFKRISQNNWKDRLVTKALKHEIAIYSFGDKLLKKKTISVSFDNNFRICKISTYFHIFYFFDLNFTLAKSVFENL